jgi:hypothetical protein
MPFPRISYCIVCESVRPELGGKLSVLGFFGVAPNVEVGIARFDEPLLLSFILGFDPALDAGPYNHQVMVRNADTSVLIASPVSGVNVIPGRPGLIVFGGMVQPPQVNGPRTINVLINGQQVFEERFMIRQARTDELAGMPGARLQ